MSTAAGNQGLQQCRLQGPNYRRQLTGRRVAMVCV